MDSKVLFQNKYNMLFGDSSTTFYSEFKSITFAIFPQSFVIRDRIRNMCVCFVLNPFASRSTASRLVI